MSCRCATFASFIRCLSKHLWTEKLWQNVLSDAAHRRVASRSQEGTAGQARRSQRGRHRFVIAPTTMPSWHCRSGGSYSLHTSRDITHAEASRDEASHQPPPVCLHKQHGAGAGRYKATCSYVPTGIGCGVPDIAQPHCWRQI